MDQLLKCDNEAICGSSTLYDEERARVGGWHILHGTTIGGNKIDHYLCPQCAGSRGQRRAAPPVLDGQLDLFDM